VNTYAVCILISAFLLFQIQPIISKTLLPWFGGTPAVWSAAMLFFQVLLTGGYAWSNWLVNKGRHKKQAVIHLILLCASLILVLLLWGVWPSPITPAENLRPASLAHPLFSIFLLLTISVGLPFFVLSTNSPLMQVWFERKNPGKSPYWLYALSNIGSLVGLITYPVVVEPFLTTRQQGWVWAAGYLLFVLFAAINAILTIKAPPVSVITDDAPKPAAAKRPAKTPWVKWMLLSACASLLLLAITSQITQEVAVIPFLWVLPLSIYLLTFVLTFSNRAWYKRSLFIVLLFAGTAGSLLMLVFPQTHFIVQIIIYTFFLFAACMVCNGELYALRPPAAQLTRFYLWGSIGGALGGLFVTLIAPLIFKGYWELYFGLIFVWFLLWITPPLNNKKDKTASMAGAMTIVGSMLVVLILVQSGKGNVFTHRNFFGVVTVRQSVSENTQQPVTILAHGITMHGFQFLDPALCDTPTSYYTKNSGAGLAIVNNPHYGSGMHVGVLGLGIGTLAAYAQPGDDYRMYEINPVIVDLANGQDGYFSFIEDSQADIEIVLGDARISLENELKAGRKNEFDVLVLDTFNSDSIPAHLLSQQAFEVYLQNLAADGVIAANISNRRLDLRSVFWQLAQHFDLHMAIIEELPKENDPTSGFSDWVLFTRSPELYQVPALTEKIGSLDGFRKDTRLWTDDYSNLIPLLR
jgi:hypothetical protein